MTYSIMTLSIECHGDCRFAKCRNYLTVLLSVLMLSVVMLNIAVPVMSDL
jgi:hypothetical protein